MDRQKLLLIFGASIVCAALVSWFVLSQAIGPKTEKMRKVMAASRDMPAGTRLRKTDLKIVSVTEKDLPRTAIFDEKTALDRVLLYPANSNETLSTTKLTTLTGAEGVAATIDPGKRAVSVPITDSSSAGGLIQPRSRVDVMFTRTGSMAEAVTATILEDVVVLSMGRNTETGQVDPKAPRPNSLSATLMVTPDEAKKLELAKNQGKISLALRNPLDRSIMTENSAVTAETIDPMLGLHVDRRGRTVRNVPNLRDNKVWGQITGTDDEAKKVAVKAEKKEPPKPRWIVDVYRGEKHVQEIFQ